MTIEYEEIRELVRVASGARPAGTPLDTEAETEAARRLWTEWLGQGSGGVLADHRVWQIALALRIAREDFGPNPAAGQQQKTKEGR